MTDSLIDDSGLGEIDKNLVYGDIMYLADSGLVKGQYMLGRASPFAIQITNHGIDVVESIIDDFVQDLETAKIGNDVKTDMRQISTENSPNIRIKKVWEYVKEHPDFILNVFDKFLKHYLGPTT
jgi:hypothetical protein